MKKDTGKPSKFGGRDRLLKVSLNEFSQRGFDQVSVDEIVSRLGVAKGTFYYYFSSKDALFWELIDKGLEKLKNVMETKNRRGGQNNILLLDEAEFFLNNIEWSQLFASEYWKMRGRNKKASKHVDDSIDSILNMCFTKEPYTGRDRKNMIFWIPLIFSLKLNYLKQKTFTQEDKRYLIEMAKYNL